MLLPENYPENIPNILLNSPQLKREILSILRKDATDCANERRGECMVFSILQNIQDNLEKICHNSSTVQEDSKLEQSSEIWNVLLSLDHMRAKTKYIKTIEKWTNELNIQGRLLFYGKLIFILLQGEHSSIKEYIVRQRSVNVDIDSRGRSCKERMLSVICEEKAEGQKRFKDFSVVECDFVDDIVKLFTEWDLTYIYSKYIKDIYL